MLRSQSPAARLLVVVITALAVLAPAAPVRAERTDEEKRVDEAVARALRYLASQQEPSGAWRIRAYGESTAATSLAVMAFLAAGHVPGEGPYGEAINQGIEWVLDHQVEYDRDRGEEAVMLVHRRSHGPMYSHGISTLMLAEVVGMVDKAKAAKCREALEKSVRLILKAQNIPKDPRRHAGGWRYQPSSRDSDLSVTGWQLLALRAAKNVGCDVPADNIDKAVEYVKNCQSSRGRGFGYQPGGSPTPTRTGTGILCLEICGRHKTDEALAGAEYLLDRPLHFRDHYFFYGVYYCTVGMFKIGDKYWEETRRHVYDLLVHSQLPDGSWSSRGSERNAGPIYCTAMSVLALAVEYRYLPIYQR